MYKVKAKQRELMSKGDKLNQLEAKAIVGFKVIMGDMTDLEAIIALQELFKESIPSYELSEVLENIDV